MSRAGTERGLSLVELLVTLVLVGLAATLVIGGIGQGTAVLGRVSADQGQVYEELMARSWLRQTIEAAVPPLANEQEFTGGPSGLRLRSFRPLLGAEGIATDIDWEAGTEGQLAYSEGDQQFALEALPPLAYFEYQDAQHAWHREWPDGDTSGLPDRVALVFAGDDDRMEISLRTNRTTPAGADEEDFDSE
jgi:prepilin-type N-terminal cleavage/methylation domain-containing protein